jgi:hypothetical protein
MRRELRELPGCDRRSGCPRGPEGTMTEVRVMLTPGSDGAWHLRLRPVPTLASIPGLDREGECVGLAAPDYSALDRFMVARGAGYTRRLHASGLVELTVSSDRARAALFDWLAGLLEKRR